MFGEKRCENCGYGVHLAAAFVLLVAATAKSYQAVLEPYSLGLGGFYAYLPYSYSKTIVYLSIAIEFASAIWLISGVCLRACQWLAFCLFFGFSLMAVVLALGKESSCGCFGYLSVNPWLTFILDLVFALIFLGIRITCKGRAVRAVAYKRFFATAVAVALISALLAVNSLGQQLRQSRLGSAWGRHALIDTSSWDGKVFPLAQFIDDVSTVMRGENTVVLFRNNCRACLAKLDSYEVRRRQGESLFLLSIPPHGDGSKLSGDFQTSNVLPILYLSDNHRWYATTPSEIYLRNGVVVSR